MLPPPKYCNNLATGAFYFAEGTRLIWCPTLRPYLLVPLAVNIALFIVLTATLVHYLGGLSDWIVGALPTWLTWLQPLAWIAWAILGILLLIVYGYSFNLITNFVAAPFYGLLALKAEQMLTGKVAPEESLWQMVPRVMLRELGKIWYFISRGFIVVLLMCLFATIPFVNVLAPLIGLAWAAWTMSIQYTDYAADNHQKSFKTLRDCLWKKHYSCGGFGTVLMLCSITPIINIFAMPAGVTGGTLFWLRELKGCQDGACNLDGED